MEKFSQVLDLCTSYNIPVTVHAGEWPNCVHNVKEAIKYSCVERIGHAVALQNEQILMDLIAASKAISIECCLTANVGKKVKSYQVHPIRDMFRSGIPVTLNCDNLLLSGDLRRQPNPTGEIIHLLEDVKMDIVALREMLIDGVRHSFDKTIEKGWLDSFIEDVDSILSMH